MEQKWFLLRRLNIRQICKAEKQEEQENNEMMLTSPMIYTSQERRKWNAKIWREWKMEGILDNEYEIMQKRL